MTKSSLKTILIASALSVFGSTSFAAELSFPEFVESCKNPENYGHQRPPQNIRVVCEDIKRTWEPIESGTATLAEARNLSAELFSDKHHVVLENFVIAVPELNVSCPRFREVMSTTVIETALTCAQVIDEERALREICIDAVNEAISGNPDLVVTVPTGRTYSTCEGTGQKP
jgi:hypothetical protein